MLTDLQRAAQKLLAYRAGGADLEADFVATVDDASERGTAKSLAGAIGISPQLLSDIRRGRRPVTDNVLNNIVGEARGN